MRIKSYIYTLFLILVMHFLSASVFAQSYSPFDSFSQPNSKIFEEENNSPNLDLNDAIEFNNAQQDKKKFLGLEEMINEPQLGGQFLNKASPSDEFSFIPKDKDVLFSEKLKELQRPDLKGEVELNLDIDLVAIDLARALDTALHNNFDIKILQQKQDNAKWVYYESVSDYLPDFGYSFDIARYTGEFLAGNIIAILVNETPIQSKLFMDWDIFDGMERVYNVRSNKHLYKKSKFDAEFTTDEALRDTAVKYYTLLGFKIEIEIYTVNLEQRKAQLKINYDRFKAGVGTKFDVLRAEANVAQAEQELIDAYNKFRLAQADLANTLGVSIFTPLFPVERDLDEKTLIDSTIDLESLANIAIDNRPDLKAQRHNVIAFESQKRSNYSEYIPTLNITSQLSSQGTSKINPRRGGFVKGTLNWDFASGLGFKGVADIKAADASLQEQKLTLINKTREVKEKVLTSYYNSIASKEKIQAAQEEAKASNESLRLAVLRLETGIGLFVDVLQAQFNATEAKVELIRAIIDYNIAQVELLFDTGVISVGNLLGGYKDEAEGTIK